MNLNCADPQQGMTVWAGDIRDGFTERTAPFYHHARGTRPKKLV